MRTNSLPSAYYENALLTWCRCCCCCCCWCSNSTVVDACVSIGDATSFAHASPTTFLPWFISNFSNGDRFSESLSSSCSIDWPPMAFRSLIIERLSRLNCLLGRPFFCLGDSSLVGPFAVWLDWFSSFGKIVVMRICWMFTQSIDSNGNLRRCATRLNRATHLWRSIFVLCAARLFISRSKITSIERFGRTSCCIGIVPRQRVQLPFRRCQILCWPIQCFDQGNGNIAGWNVFGIRFL